MSMIQINLRNGLKIVEGSLKNVYTYPISPCRCGSRNIILIQDTRDSKYHDGSIKCLSCDNTVKSDNQYGLTDKQLVQRWNNAR